MSRIEKLSVSSGSETDVILTPESNELSSSPENRLLINLPPGGFDDPMNDIYELNPEELDGNVLPTVLIPSEMWAQAVDRDVWYETFCIPAHMGGVLIGRLGKNVRELRNIWQAEFSLNTCPGKQDTLIFKLSCPLKNKDNVLRWVSQRFRMRPSRTTIGEVVAVHIRSLYGLKELFVTIPDKDYSNYLSMQSELDKDYSSTTNFRIHLCEPVTSGTVAVVSHSQGFARALIISVYQSWPKVVFYFLLDHGTFGVTPLNNLRKIRAKYMRIPFQAIHVSWAHAFPVFSDIPDLHLLRTFFNSGRTHVFAVRMETCCRPSVAFCEPYSQPYSPNGFLDTLVTACNSGLFMAAPLIIYPKRQCWLNGTNIPYYPFTYSAIDYQSLVNFSIEDDNNLQCTCIENDNNFDKVKFIQNDHSKLDRNSDINTRPPWSKANRFRRNQGSITTNQYPSQKENMYISQSIIGERNVVDNSVQYKVNFHKQNSQDSIRKPLSLYNNRGGAVTGSKTSYRGRTGSQYSR